MKKRKIRIIKLNKTFNIIIFHIILFIILLRGNVDFNKISILKDEFIIPFILSLIGIFLAIITLLYGLLEKIIKAFDENVIPMALNNIYKSLDEIKENTLFIFYILIFCITMGIWCGYDIPKISIPFYLKKDVLISTIKTVSLSLVMFASHDTIKTFFIILSLSQKIK